MEYITKGGIAEIQRKAKESLAKKNPSLHQLSPSPVEDTQYEEDEIMFLNDSTQAQSNMRQGGKQSRVAEGKFETD